MNTRTIDIGLTQIKFQNSHTVYENFIKCTIKDYEFNLSYNPTLLSGSQATLVPYSSSVGGDVFYNPTGSEYFGILKPFVTGSEFSPYASEVGLYNDAGDLLAVAKLASPMPLSSNTDMTFLVKFDTQWINKPYFTPTPTPSMTPYPSVIPASPSISPTPSITTTVTPSVTPSIGTSVTPSVTPSLTPSTTPSISITPSATPSISVTPSTSEPSLARIDWITGPKGAGAGTLIIRDIFGTSLVNETTTPSTKTGTVYVNQSNLPYSVTGSWSAGSGNIVRYRVCDISNGGEIFYSGDIDNTINSVSCSVSPTPLYVQVQLTSGATNYPGSCPI